jgi:hypothetical protein
LKILKMSLFKQLALAASLPAMALLTVAKTPVEDVDLRQVEDADLKAQGIELLASTSGGGSSQCRQCWTASTITGSDGC